MTSWLVHSTPVSELLCNVQVFRCQALMQDSLLSFRQNCTVGVTVEHHSGFGIHSICEPEKHEQVSKIVSFKQNGAAFFCIFYVLEYGI